MDDSGDLNKNHSPPKPRGYVDIVGDLFGAHEKHLASLKSAQITPE
jgi:hypothetical protein